MVEELEATKVELGVEWQEIVEFEKKESAK
jgi:hypothetical protein